MAADEDLRGAVRVSLQPRGRSRPAGRPRSRKAYFKWFNEDHTDDQHRYDYREWFNRVNQQPRIAGNAPYLDQVRTAAVATLTDAEKADTELAAILAAYCRRPRDVDLAARLRPRLNRARAAAVPWPISRQTPEKRPLTDSLWEDAMPRFVPKR